MVMRELITEKDLQENIMKRIKEAGLYSRRFGSFAKADYEILFFTAYLDSLKKPARDYEISIDLGITESKVRNLRVKSQLLYPKELKWVEELSKSILNGYYDSGTEQITLTFEDPSVQNLMKNRIEEGFGTVGQSLNAKQLILPIESFLLLAAYAETDEAEILNKINEHLQTELKTKAIIEKKNFKARFLVGIPNKIEFLGTLLTVYEVGKPIIEALLQKIV